MPKNKFQEVIFTIIMVFFMVYAMICYNIALNIGGMKNEVFLSAFHELIIMGPIAFILDFFIVGKIAKAKAFKIVDVRRDNPFHLVLAISFVSALPIERLKISIIVLVVLMITVFKKISPTAAWLNVPYQLWLIFAAYLNIATAIING